MRLLPIVVVLVVLCVASSEAGLFKDNEYVQMFKTFLTKFKKTYSTSAFAQKLLTFKANLDKITNFNALKKRYQLGVNEFSDLSAAEFKKYMGAVPKAYTPGSLIEAGAGEELSLEALNNVFAEGFNWQSQNVLLAPRQQDQCGSCWAFAAASTIEAALAIKNPKAKKEYLSTQMQVNCAAYGCNGCGGGFGQCAFDFAIRVGYFREKDEPYRNNRFACRMREVEPLGKITSFSYVQPSMSRFTRAVRNNPLWVTLDANALQFYRSGIVTGNSSAPNHAVTMVGYGSEDEYPYYIIRNSWGKSWGESGHFRIGAEGNVMGIHSFGAYMPIITDTPPPPPVPRR